MAELSMSDAFGLIYLVSTTLYVIFCTRTKLVELLSSLTDNNLFSYMIVFGSFIGSVWFLRIFSELLLWGDDPEIFDPESRGFLKGIILIPCIVVYVVFLSWKTKTIRKNRSDNV